MTLLIVKFKIRFDQCVSFELCREVFRVVLDAEALRMSVVDGALVQVVCDVHSHRVPTTILIINQGDFRIVF
jgi:hypothetical protein